MIEETFKYNSVAELRMAIEDRIKIWNESDDDTLISLDNKGDVGWFKYSDYYLEKSDISCSVKAAEVIFELCADPKLLYMIHLYFSYVQPESYNKNQLW